MATGWPMKTTYANGDVYSAGDVNDITGTINLLGSSVAYAAGKNKIINGDYRFNQRKFTSNTANRTYNFDRWFQQNSGGSFTVTPQTFTPGAAPVTGYESTNFVRGITASQSAAGDYAVFSQRIEDVTTLANQTATISFWAKAGSGTPKIAVEVLQNFGLGGSPSANVDTAFAAVTLSTSWARYSLSATIPSLTGKTIGSTANTSYVEINLWTSAGTTFNSRASSIGIQNNTFDVWGVQVEEGSTATAFQTASGTIQGELAACQRYFQIYGGTQNYELIGSSSVAASSTSAYAGVDLLVEMRTVPSIVTSFYSNVNEFTLDGGNNNYRLTALSLNSGANAKKVRLNCTVASGLTTSSCYPFLTFSTSTGKLALSSEF